MDEGTTVQNQIKKLEEKIKTASLPKDLAEKLEEEISLVSANLKGEGASFINLENVSKYVNWVTSLPFGKETKDILDLTKAREILDKNHYGLDQIKNRILEYLSSLILTSQNKTEDRLSAPILCLLGLVGTGKTTLGYSIAQALSRKFQRIPLGGMGDAKALRGQSRVYPDAEPGLIIKNLISAQTKNPVLLLDEIDRVTEEGRADIMGVLVELLDPEQNSAFLDHYIDYPFDLSHVLFIATANNTTNISTAVLDRLEIIQMPSYSDLEKTAIAKSFLFPKIQKETGLSSGQISIDEAVWPTIIRPLGYDSGMRSLERAIEGICRKVAKLIVEGKAQSVAITEQNIKDFLTT